MLSININNQNLRFVQVSNQKITRWGKIDLPTGLVKDGNILNPEQLAAIIAAGLKKEGLQSSDAVVSLTGLSFIYRYLTLPPIKNALLAEAVQRATQKEINVPLEDLYLEWKIINETPKQTDIFVIGSPRTSVDALVKTLELAKIKMLTLELNSLAQARVVNRLQAVTVNCENDWFDIAIVSGGLPVTLHTAAPKGTERDVSENLSQLADEIRRTIEFFNLAHKDEPLPPNTPIYLGGLFADNPEIRSILASYLTNPLEDIKTGMGTLPGFSEGLYAVNLGLLGKIIILKNISEKSSAYHDLDIDLLNGRRRARKVPVVWKNYLVPASIIVLIILLVPLVSLQWQAASTTQRLNTELERANRMLNLRRMMLDENLNTRQSIDALNAKTQALRNDMSLVSGKGDLSSMVNTLIMELPVGAEFVNIASTASQITLEGQSASRDAVIQYVQKLSGSTLFSVVRLALLESVNDPGLVGNLYSFTIIIQR
jgi:Tfp pilus assembly PilM family ATPase/Tfp pilus assembly protein PilN